MSKNPAKTFNEFVSIIRNKNITELFEIKQEKFDELLRPFIVNPSKNEHYLQIICSLKWAILFTKRVYELIHLPKFLKNKIIKESFLLQGIFEEFDIVNKISLENAQPCELNIDLLPTRILETPEEWKNQNLLIHLLEIRVSVIPENDLIPNAIELRLDILENEDVKIIESFPTTDFSDTGEYQISISEGGKFTQRKSKATSFELGGEVGNKIRSPNLLIGENQTKLSSKFSTGTEKSTEEEKSESFGYNFRYTNKVIKVISSAVGRRANWKILRTNDNIPIGGITFYVSCLVPSNINIIKSEINLVTNLDLFGDISIIKNSEIVISSRN